MNARTKTIVCPRCRRAYPISVSLGELSRLRTHVVCARCGARIDLAEHVAPPEPEVRSPARDDERAAGPPALRRTLPRRTAPDAWAGLRRRSPGGAVETGDEAPPTRETPRSLTPPAPRETPRLTLAAVGVDADARGVPAAAAEPGPDPGAAAAPREAPAPAWWLELVASRLEGVGDDLPASARLLEALLEVRDD